MNIKSFFLTFAALFAGLVICNAQNDALSFIAKKNAGVSSLESSFKHTKTMKTSGKVTVSSGTLYYVAPDKLSMLYEAPSTDYLVINGDTMDISRGDKASSFNTAKNPLMAQLRNVLLLCVSGKVKEAADSNDAEISVESASGFYVITLTSRTKSSRGYSKVVLKYSKTTGILSEMETTEMSQIVNLYQMSGIKVNPK
ncbi:MAG: outer membrane lipoprotein carrier protein LolA [Bacteroidales bacterium]|nr:outer membrane lipoprotein carrier protein LolA [Bacteroidales bacterium]MBQ4287569.1 outer membrane lipoprotein carrier protein LolA [Bacteroidales bacterium]